MKRFFCCWLLVVSLVTVSGLQAFTGAASFLREGVGAEEVSMGGASTAGAQGVNSVYWNPAGLTRMDASDWQIGSMYSVETLDRYYGYLGFAKHTEEYGEFGVSLIAYGVSNIDILDETGELKGSESDSEFAMGFSYANKINYQFRYGFTFKGHYQDLIGYRATGYSVDLGLIFQPILDQEIFFGVMLQNVLGDMFWTGYSENVLSIYKAGASAKFFEEVLRVNFDLVKEEGDDALIYKAGVEFRLLEYLFIRGGIDEKYPVAGLGFKYENYKVDYAFVYDKNELGNMHQVSLVLMW